MGATLRVTIGSLVLAPVFLKDISRIQRLRGRDWLYTLAISVFGIFGFSALMLYGMQMVTGVVGSIVMSITPAVTALASMVFMKDHPTWRMLGAVALAVAGVLIIHAGGNTSGDAFSEPAPSPHPWFSGLEATVYGCLFVFGGRLPACGREQAAWVTRHFQRH